MQAMKQPLKNWLPIKKVFANAIQGNERIICLWRYALIATASTSLAATAYKANVTPRIDGDVPRQDLGPI